ncbi:MAG: class IV adenylate cyclase [bacterium]
MKNKLEIEKKYKVNNSSVEELTKKIEKIGAVFAGDKDQLDIYFNVPGRDSFTSKECLRIRSSDTGKEITYKPSTREEYVDKGFFAKKEINLPINDVGIAKILLQDIGCTILAEVKKRRRQFRLDKFKICIDNINNLGLFIEIEIMDVFDNIQKSVKEIDKLMSSLNLINYSLEDKPYRDLVMAKEKGGR